MDPQQRMALEVVYEALENGVDNISRKISTASQILIDNPSSNPIFYYLRVQHVGLLRLIYQ